MRLSIITPTGFRPYAFNLCRRYVERQTIFATDIEVEWIVVTDDPEFGAAMPELPSYASIFTHFGEIPEGNTQAFNMLAGVEAATGDVLAFVEDDDWYHPRYLQTMVQNLISLKTNLLGLRPTFFYNVKERRHRIIPTRYHAPLCQTVISKALVPDLVDILASWTPNVGKQIDLMLWNRAPLGERVTTFQGKNEPLVVGIKGLPGRPGITGHKVTDLWKPDPLMWELKKWIGYKDTKNYEELSG